MMTHLDRCILRLALPSIVSNITVPLLGLCDVVIMGHVGGAAGIGAIAVGSMIFNVMYWLFVFLRMSTSGMTAQAYGAGLTSEAHTILRRSLGVALAFGTVIVVLQVPLRWLTFWLMQAKGDVEQLCLPYYYICIWGAPAVLGLYALTGWLIGMQDTRLPMFIAIGQNVVNIGISLLLVVVLGWDIQGVAIGTLVAQWAGFIAGLAMVWAKGGRLTAATRPSAIPPSTFTLRATFRINLDIFLRTVCLVSVNLYFTSAGAAQGVNILAANTLLMQFFTFYSYMMDGFAFAGEALAGRYLGASNLRMLSSTVRHLFIWGTGVALSFTAAYLLGGTALLGLLTNDVDVVATACIYLPWAVAIPAAGMAAFVWDGIFIGTTRSRGMLLSCLGAAATFFLLFLLLAPVMHNHALWLALIVYLAMRGILQTVIWNRQ